MQLFLTDETNLQPTDDARFFVYGGLIIPFDRFLELDRGIQTIRATHSYRPGDELKFDTRSRPEHVTIGDATAAKREVVELALSLDCKFIAHIILHDIVRNQDPDYRVQSAADFVLGRFNYYLREIGDHGIVVVDNLPVHAQFRYLSERFCHGLDLQSERRVALDRIRLFAASCSTASLVHSAIDIVLGSFRYCINNPRNPQVAREMMLNVVRMMWHRYEAATDTYYVADRGLITRPRLNNIRFEAYRREYESLFRHLNELLGEGAADEAPAQQEGVP